MRFPSLLPVLWGWDWGVGSGEWATSHSFRNPSSPLPPLPARCLLISEEASPPCYKRPRPLPLSLSIYFSFGVLGEGICFLYRLVFLGTSFNFGIKGLGFGLGFHAERCGMLGMLMRLLSRCWSPAGRSSAGGDGDDGREEGREGLLWFRDIGRCAGGDFSMAVVQANQVLEDQSQIESGPFGTFIGVYDGHGGPDAARYVCDHLFRNFREISSLSECVTSDGIRSAFLKTEESFIELVQQLWNSRPDLATTGSCCLVGFINQGTLFVANTGDSRAVLGRKISSTGDIAAIQLSTEHNANVEAVRQELKAQHPNDPQIVVLRHGVWRVKGIIQVSRSIGDAYMKHSQYNREPINPKFRISEPMKMPILTANPTIICHSIQTSDSFLIFASDGLWEHLSNEKAVEIVHNHPHAGSAKRLVKAALQEAARKREMRYSDLKRIDMKVRRHFHDDITVIIIFLNHDLLLLGNGFTQLPTLSVRSS